MVVRRADSAVRSGIPCDRRQRVCPLPLESPAQLAVPAAVFSSKPQPYRVTRTRRTRGTRVTTDTSAADKHYKRPHQQHLAMWSLQAPVRRETLAALMVGWAYIGPALIIKCYIDRCM